MSRRWTELCCCRARVRVGVHAPTALDPFAPIDKVSSAAARAAQAQDAELFRPTSAPRRRSTSLNTSFVSSASSSHPTPQLSGISDGQAPSFNLEHAVHVAAHAFSAYLEPVAGQELTEFSVPLPEQDSVKTQFFGAAFVRRHFCAALRVTVLRAEGLVVAEVRLLRLRTACDGEFASEQAAPGIAWHDILVTALSA